MGSRIKLKYTRAMVDAIHQGDFDSANFEKDPNFGFMIPDSCPGVPEAVLTPKNTWDDKKAYEATNSGVQIGVSDIARELVSRVVDAAEELGVKTVISPECGHAFTAIHWDGANLIGRPYNFEVKHILEVLDRLRVSRRGEYELQGAIQAIIDAASYEFREAGFAATSMDRIAERAEQFNQT